MSGDGPELSRRALLAGTTGIGLAATGVGGVVLGRHISEPASSVEPGASTGKSVPFHGAYQAGITTPAPAAGVVIALDLTVTGRARLIDVLRGLTDGARGLVEGQLLGGGQSSGSAPGGSGILGPRPMADGLTITLSVGASLFDNRFGLSGRRLRQLTLMHRFPNDQLDARRCHGDLLLVVAAAHTDTVLYAARYLLRSFADSISPRWMQHGFLRPDAHPRRGRTEVRNLLGFKDGSANPDTTDAEVMDELVWVQPGDGEPAWAVGGSYQVVRIIRMFVERWDSATTAEQEGMIGRDKATGAPVGGEDESEEPDYESDPHGVRVPLTSHIRRANPRTTNAMGHRILRRGLSYSNSLDDDAQLDEGLLFICYQRDLDQGFTTIQARLNGEPLEKFVRPVGGGYFFALPGVRDGGRFLGDLLVA
jgi:deferrochelatase/peroxidase EfeB